MPAKKFQGLLVLFLIILTMGAGAWAQEVALPRGDAEKVLEDFSQLSGGNKNLLLASAGITPAGDFDWGKTVAGVIFGGIGFVAFVYGKKNALWKPMVIGILLMGYPYFIPGTVMVLLAGIGLTIALYLFRE